jgi:hypothetical protein
MVSQKAYRQVTANKLLDLFHKNTLTFTALVISDRAEDEFQTCLNNINDASGQITSANLLNSFLGYAPYEKPIVIYGKINLQDYVKVYNQKQITYQDPTKIPITDQQQLLNYILRAYH